MKFLNPSFFKEILYGKWRKSSTLKYSLICFSFSIIHLALLCFFSMFHVMPMVAFGAFSVCLYLFCGFYVTKKKRYFHVLYIALIEVICHAIVACYYIGWDYGFMLYSLAMVPVLFYLFTTTPNIKNPNIHAVISILIIVTSFIITKFTLGNATPVYDLNVSTTFVQIVYCINCGVAFFMQSVFSALYTVEVRHFRENLEREKNALHIIAHIDPLTNLLNRRAMQPHLENSKVLADTDSKPFSVILCDIDNFKRVNDVYGHSIGDQVLRDIAHTFASNLDKEDYVCRWGGEEFLILVPDTQNTAVNIAEKLRKEVEKLIISTDDATLSVTMTFGVAEYIKDSRIESMIKKADDNLYTGKDSGKNRVVSS